MASFRFTKLKITIGYILLLAILLFSLVFVHQEMETLSAESENRQSADPSSRKGPEYPSDAAGIERGE